MPGHYQKVRLLSDDDDDNETSDQLNITVESQSHVSLSKRMLVVLSAFIFFNMILAASNAYYSFRMSQLLKEYEEKDLSSLRRIDPFDGSYRPESKGENYINIHSLTAHLCFVNQGPY